jgi:hypothetical protein
LISQFLEGGPVERASPGFRLVQMLGPLAHALKRCLGLVLVDAPCVGDKSSDGLTVSGNDDFFATLDAVKQSS